MEEITSKASNATEDTSGVEKEESFKFHAMQYQTEVRKQLDKGEKLDEVKPTEVYHGKEISKWALLVWLNAANKLIALKLMYSQCAPGLTLTDVLGHGNSSLVFSGLSKYLINITF